jgi:hypothetical protein
MPRRHVRERRCAERVGDFRSFVPVERHLASSTQHQTLAALNSFYLVVPTVLSQKLVACSTRAAMSTPCVGMLLRQPSVEHVNGREESAHPIDVSMLVRSAPVAPQEGQSVG